MLTHLVHRNLEIMFIYLVDDRVYIKRLNHVDWPAWLDYLEGAE